MADETNKKKRRAVLKARRTRLANQAMLRRWREVDEPTSRRMNVLLNMFLPAVGPIKLRWNPLGGVSRKLMHGAEYGELIKFLDGGRRLLVLPDGYKRPQSYHPGFWEPLGKFQKWEATRAR